MLYSRLTDTNTPNIQILVLQLDNYIELFKTVPAYFMAIYLILQLLRLYLYIPYRMGINYNYMYIPYRIGINYNYMYHIEWE